MEIDAFWASRGRGPGRGARHISDLPGSCWKSEKGVGARATRTSRPDAQEPGGGWGQGWKGRQQAREAWVRLQGRLPGAVKWKGRGLWGLRAGLKRGSSVSRPCIQGASGAALLASRLRSCPSVLPEPVSTAETGTLQPGWGRLWGARGVGSPPPTHTPTPVPQRDSGPWLILS